MIPAPKPSWAALSAAAVLALLAACSHTPTPVSPAVVSQPPPAPTAPPMPADEDLGTPSGTFTALANPGTFSLANSGLYGIGTLHFRGRRYRFIVDGVNTRGFAGQVSPINGEAFNLTRITDFAGSYTPIAMSENRKEIVLENEARVTIRVGSLQPFEKGFQSLTIRLTR
jgi:hypothetical protein